MLDYKNIKEVAIGLGRDRDRTGQHEREQHKWEEGREKGEKS